MAPYPKLCKALEHLIDRWGPIEGRTRLTKLIYLADRDWAKTHDQRPYTEADYYRWNHGPYSREIPKAIEWMDGIEIAEEWVPWDGGETYNYRAGVNTRLAKVQIDADFVEVLDRVGGDWGKRPLKELLEFVYGEKTKSGDRLGDLDFGVRLFEKV